MAMSLGGSSREAEVMVDINTTPLIDVMLVLLIMLIITIPIQTHAVKLNMPIAKPPANPVLPTVITIDIDFDGAMIWTVEPLTGRTGLARRMHAAAASQEQ